MDNPTELDLMNYSYAVRESPYFKHPGRFLKLGDRVRAKFRIFDLPQASLSRNWGPVHANEGELGTVIHTERGNWPTVRFDRTGTLSCVTDFEVEKVETV